MVDCIEHQWQVSTLCVDTRCRQQCWRLCQKCINGSNNTHYAHKIITLTQLQEEVQIFDREKSASEAGLRQNVVRQYQRKLRQLRCQIDSLLNAFEVSLINEAQKLTFDLNLQEETLINHVLEGYMPQTVHRRALQSLFCSLIGREHEITETIRNQYTRKVELKCSQIIDTMRTLVQDKNVFDSVIHNSSDNWQKPRLASGVANDRTIVMSPSKCSKGKHNDRNHRSSSEKHTSVLSAHNHTHTRLYRYQNNRSNNDMPIKKKYSLFRPSFVNGMPDTKNKSTSNFQEMKRNSREIDSDLTLKIQANREALTGGSESKVLSMIEERLRNKRQQQETSEDRVKQMVQNEVEKAIKKEVTSLLQFKTSDSKFSSPNNQPETDYSPSNEVFLPLQSRNRFSPSNTPQQKQQRKTFDQIEKVTNNIAQTKKSSVQQVQKKISPENKVQFLDENKVFQPKPTQQLHNPSVQSFNKTSVGMTLPVVIGKSGTLTNNNSKKILKKARTSLNRTIKQNDQNNNLPTVRETVQSPIETVQIIQLKQTPKSISIPQPIQCIQPIQQIGTTKPTVKISKEEFAHRLQLIPKLSNFLEQNLKQMEEAWRRSDLMCWNRYFQLKIQSDLDSGDHLSMKKKCKKHSFQSAELIESFEQSLARIKITSVKKKKNLLIMQYLLMHLMELIVLIEGFNIHPSDSIFSFEENESILQQLGQDNVAAANSFLTLKLSRLKKRLPTE